MTDHPDIIKFFYKNPSYKNYTKVRKYIDPKINIKTYKYRIHYTMFLYIIDKYYPRYKLIYDNTFYKRFFICFKNKTNLKNIVDFINCKLLYKHIMGEPSLLCVTDLDILWLLFYATGHNIYSEQVKLCATSNKYDIVNSDVVRTNALLSYNNHVIKKIIIGDKIIENKQQGLIKDPLFLYPVDKFNHLYDNE